MFPLKYEVFTVASEIRVNIAADALKLISEANDATSASVSVLNTLLFMIKPLSEFQLIIFY